MAIARYGVKSHLSLAVVHGNTAYLSGHIARGGTTVAEQTTDILDQIDEQLAEVGSHRTKLLSANIWLTDIGTFSEMNEVWLSWIGEDDPPARATVEANLADPKLLVEIMAVAAID